MFDQQIFTAGFTGAQRQQVRSLAEAAGCEYRGDLIFGRCEPQLLMCTRSSGLDVNGCSKKRRSGSNNKIACRTTHLIFKPHAGVLDSSKVRTAQQWGIPVVHWQWLLDNVDK